MSASKTETLKLTDVYSKPRLLGIL